MRLQYDGEIIHKNYLMAVQNEFNKFEKHFVLCNPKYFKPSVIVPISPLMFHYCILNNFEYVWRTCCFYNYRDVSSSSDKEVDIATK